MAKRKPFDDSLVAEYQRGVSVLHLAAVSGLSLNTILRRLRERGIPIRSSERQPYQRFNLTPSNEASFKEIVDGLLLGDGSITKDGSLRLIQTSRRYSWLEYVQGLLAGIGVPSRVIPVPERRHPAVIEGREIRTTSACLLYTPQALELRQHRSRWYPEVKRVPQDVSMSSLATSLWFCGDGSYTHNGGLMFCTNCFPEEDVEALRRSLAELGITSALQRTSSGLVLAIYRRDDANRLKNYMGELPEVFQYKTAHVRAAIPRGHSLRTLTEEQIQEIRQTYTGRNGAALGRKFNVSSVTVNRIVRGLIYRDL